jgi:type I restriction enzyme, R subunit
MILEQYAVQIRAGATDFGFLAGDLAAVFADRYWEGPPKRMIDAEKSDLYDVLAYIAFALSPITREERVSSRKGRIYSHYSDDKLRTLLDFVLSEYVKEGVGELDQSKLTPLLELKYQNVTDAATEPGGIAKIRDTFIGFQKYLYADVL